MDRSVGRFRRRPEEAGRLRLVVDVVGRLWRVSRPLTGACLVFMGLSVAVPLVLTVVSGIAVGAVPGAVEQGLASEPGRRLLGALVVAGALVAGLSATDAIRYRMADVLGWRLRADHRQRLMAAALGPEGIAHVEDPAVQDALGRSDSHWVRSIPEGLVSVGILRLGGLGAAALLAWHQPLAGVVLGGAWTVAGCWRWRRATAESAAVMGRVQGLRRASATSALATSPASAKEVRLFGLGEWLGRRFSREWHEAMAEVWAQRRHRPGQVAAVVALLVGAHVVALVLVARAATTGNLSLGDLAVALQAGLATRGLGVVSFGHYEVEYGLSAMPALAELEDLLAGPEHRMSGSRAAPVPQSEIRFEGVSFAYPGGKEVLSGLDLTVAVGTSLALVGDNGAGKSTFVQLLARLRDPTAGRITVDGVDLREVRGSAWQQSVAAVSQQIVHLPFAARDNVAAGRTLDLDDVRRAAFDAGALDTIERLPRGWDTVLSREYASGAELSGGEWQRLALARALAALTAGAQVLVLDEPSAHLDVRAEADLYDRFLDLTRGRTTVLVSHRFSTVRRADRVVVLDGGRVVEDGSHDELVGQGGRYAAMFALQAARFAVEGSS